MNQKMNNLFKVDKNVPIPLYYQIKQSLLKAIKEEILKSGDMIPTEHEICEICQVSRPTIRQALNELVSEGYLYRCKGKGTFVSLPKIEARFLNVLQSFNHEMVEKGLKPSTKVINFKVVNSREEINEALKISKGEKLLYLERLRFADDETIVYLETYLPYDMVPNLINVDMSKESLYEVLEKRYQIKVSRVKREIEAVNASSNIAQYLKIEKGKAVCLIHTVAYTEEMRPVEYSIARYRGDRSRFNVELYR